MFNYRPIGIYSSKDIVDEERKNENDISGNNFIPIVNIDKSYKDANKKFGAVYKGNVGNKKTTLSDNLDNKIQLLEEIKITVPTEIRLIVRKGNSNAGDDTGELTITSNGVIFNNINNIYAPSKLMSSTILKAVKYNSYIKIKVNPLMIQENAYIDFHANDDDWYFYSVSNVHCGRIAISNTSKIGKKLTKNIEGLPIANNSQKLSNEFTFDHPEKSFEVANKYQNPSGMCYAVTMARVAKAFTDMNFYNVLKVAAYGDDYIYSGTISKNIPDKYFGYGVGGALEKKGYADLITTQEIWDGKLEEGAILQYWNNPNKRDWKSLKEAIKLSIGKKREDWPSDFRGGHSVIFKEYILDDRDNVVALWCYDYSGIQKRFEKDDESAHKIFLGANLRDK